MQLEKYRDNVNSTIVLYAGMMLFAGGMLLPVYFQRLHMGLGILIGILVAAPVFYLGLRLSPEAANSPKTFLPNREQTRVWGWNFTLSVTWMSCFIGPCALLLFIGSFLPAGDHWPNVFTRLTYAACAFAAMWWWITVVRTMVPRWFHGKATDDAIKSLIQNEEAVAPRSVLQAVRANWQLPLIAALALCVGFGVIDLNNPIFRMDHAPKRGRAIMELLLWCRGNPNTVHSSGILVGVASIGYFAYTIFKAARVRPS